MKKAKSISINKQEDMKKIAFRILAVAMVFLVFTSCSKEFFEPIGVYEEEININVTKVYQISPAEMRVDFMVQNLSDYDYSPSVDGQFFVEFSIFSTSGYETYNEVPIDRLYSGEGYRDYIIVPIDPRMNYNINDLQYTVYNAGR